MRATVTKIVARRSAIAGPLLSRFVADEKGATGVEYAILLAMMALACIAAFSTLGGAQGGKWGDMANTVVGNLTSK